MLRRGDVIAKLTGSLRSILTIERVALNFLTHLSGIATLTRHYVAGVQDTSAKIYDTRKTLPGLRGLEKYAVTCGGGYSHRIGLYDAVLVKDNHLAHVPAKKLQASLGKAITKARRAEPPPDFIEVEVDTLEQFRQVLACKVDVILLDNMTNTQLRKAVQLRNKNAPQIQLEASGGVTMQTVSKIASTGVDRIAVGAITHSAPALDIALDIPPEASPDITP
jgi:nicotinate-nucleotide pyrophosphorylase (carboxylating)